MRKIKAIILAILCMGLINFSEGKQFYIKSGDIAAFRAAITESNTNNSADTIHLAPYGIYNFTDVDNAFVDGENALPVIREDGNTTNALTILGNGATLKRDASVANLRFFYILECKANIYDIALIGGQAAVNDSPGGAIIINGADLSLYNSLLKDNKAEEGGAVRMGIHGNFFARNCTFTNNTAVMGSGGAISTYGGQTILQNCVVVNNTCLNTNAPAAIFNYYPLHANTSTNNTYLQKTIVARNTYKNATSPNDGKEFDLFGATYTLGGNFIGAYPVVSTGVNTIFQPGLPASSNDYVGTETTPIDPKLGMLGRDGLFTDSYPLLAGSLALLNNGGIAANVKVPAVASWGINPQEAYPGDIITLTGVNLAGITKVQFSGTPTITSGITATSTTVTLAIHPNAVTGKILLMDNVPNYVFTPQDLKIKAITIPTAPTNLSGIALSTSSIKLEWQDVNDEDNYQVEYKAADDNTFTILDTTAQNVIAYTVPNLLCGTTYRFRIMALGHGTHSGYSSTIEVTTTTLSSAPVLTSPVSTSACAGNTIQLSAPAGFAGYLWSNGSTTQSIVASESGDYSVQVKDGKGCLSSFSQPVVLTFFNYPDTALTISGNELTVPSNAEHYQWYFNNNPIDGAIQNMITVTQTGTYKVEITNHGCSIFSRAVPFTITGVEEEHHTGIVVYPIPASETITVGFKGDKAVDKGVLTLMDSEGKIITSINKPARTESVSLNTSKVGHGIYLLQIRFGSNVEYRKVLLGL